MAGVFYNTCPAAGCHQLCALKVHVGEGRILKVESADYPGDPAARSVCLKGLAAPRLVYHPDRLKYPLKRIGERGEGKWQRISWDEALDTIAAKLLEVKEKYDPRSVKIMAASSSHVGILMGRLMAARFANAWGAGGVFEAKSHWRPADLPLGKNPDDPLSFPRCPCRCPPEHPLRQGDVQTIAGRDHAAGALKNTPTLSFPRRRELGDRFQICPQKVLKRLDSCSRAL